MTDQFIISKLLRTDIFSLEGYLIPRKITTKDGKEFNLYKIRKKYLEETKENPNTKALIEFLDKEYPELIYIQELPIPMKNFFLNYRSLDFFLPRYGLGVELDSHYHDDTENNDNRSDLYVYRKYGIRVIRLRLASESHKEIDLARIRKYLHTNKPLEYNFPLDFSDIIVQEFKNKYNKEMKELEMIESQFSWGMYNGNLIITEEQEKNLKPILKLFDLTYNVCESRKP